MTKTSALLDPAISNRLLDYGQQYDMKRQKMPNDVLIKPTHACQARCTYCADMLTWYYDEARASTGVPFERWVSLLDELNSIGVRRITISGGEPTTYRHLFPLLRHARSRDFYVTLNSNGWTLAQPDFLKRLSDCPPHLMVFSIDSNQATIHDECRSLPGLFERLDTGLRTIAQHRESGELTMSVGVRTIVHNRNYDHFDQLLLYLSDLDLDLIRISYIENDHDKKAWLLSPTQIRFFTDVILQKAIASLSAFSFSTDQAATLAKLQLSSLFNNQLITVEDYSNGWYWPDERIRQFCDLPSKFALVTPSGHVLPCNEAEYRRGPVIGNILSASFREIWESAEFDHIRHHKFDACRTCAGPLPMQLTIRESPGHLLVSRR